jgi:hypothetical protein
MKAKKEQSKQQCSCTTCRDHPWSGAAQEHRAINRLVLALDEKNRRRLAGLLAWQRGRGGVSLMSQITGLSRTTIRQGRDEVQHVERPSARSRVRKAGAGRSRVEKNSRGY